MATPKLALTADDLSFGLKSPIKSALPNTRDFLKPVTADVKTGFKPSDFNFGAAAPAVPERSFSDKLFGTGAAGDTGYLIPGLQALSGAAQAYTGVKALNLAEDQFAFTKDQTNRDFQNQAKVYNTQLKDQYNARLAAQGGYDTSTPEGKAQFEADLASYVKANSIDPNQVL